MKDDETELKIEGLRRENLRLRDALIAAISEIGHLKGVTAGQSARTHRELHDHLANSLSRIEDLESQIRAIHRSNSWRLGNLLIRPLSLIKRVMVR